MKNYKGNLGLPERARVSALQGRPLVCLCVVCFARNVWCESSSTSMTVFYVWSLVGEVVEWEQGSD